MKPLLEIQTIPIAIEYKMTGARVQRGTPAQRPAAGGTAGVKPQRPAQARPAAEAPRRPNTDTYERSRHRAPRIAGQAEAARATVRFYDARGNSRQVAYSASATFKEGGQVMVDLQLDATAMAAAPKGQADAAGEESRSLPRSLSVTYQLEKLQYEMRQAEEGFEFTPASIEFAVKEYPRVVIEYLGSPIYVPPSADPDYEPIDTMA